MHIRNVPSFFLTKSTGATQGDELGRINPLSNSSCSCVVLGLNPNRGTDNVKPKPDPISGLLISSSLLYSLPLTVVI
ncbi:hypothetical protein Hanom_Chr01g00039881 [Helianthus anomalus]